MDYFIRWQVTEKLPQSFLSQDKIVKEVIAPILNDGFFKGIVNNYYITKANYTDVRLQVFVVVEKNLKTLDAYLKHKLSNLSLTSKDGPCQQPVVFPYYGPLDKEQDFREYLQNISDIAIDFHLGNLDEAKKTAVMCRFRTKPYGVLEPRHCLHMHFLQNSRHYGQLIENNMVDRFWESFAISYSRLTTPWDHFYYNIILGLDPSPADTEEKVAAMIGITLE